MTINADHTPDWAIVLAPASHGWRVRYLGQGARVANDGIELGTVEEALRTVHELADLLVHDDLTHGLFVAPPVFVEQERATA